MVQGLKVGWEHVLRAPFGTRRSDSALPFQYLTTGTAAVTTLPKAFALQQPRLASMSNDRVMLDVTGERRGNRWSFP